MSAGFTFLEPGFLVLLALLPLLAFWPRRARFERAVWIRASVLTLIVLALARPVRTVPDGRDHAVLLLDRSASMGAEDPGQRIAAWRAGLSSAAVARIVSFGSDRPATVEDFELGTTLLHLGPEADLADALGAARLCLPRGARGSLTLWTDGRDGGPRASRELADLVRAGVPVHTLAPAVDRLPRPVEARLLSPVRVGGTARLAVTLAGVSSGLDVALLDVTRLDVTRLDRGTELARTRLATLDGLGQVVLTFEPDRAGFLELAVELTGADVVPVRARLPFTLPVQDPLRALYLGPRGSGAAAALSQRVGPGLEFVGAEPDAPLPDDVDLVVLDDLEAERFPVGLAETLVRRVEDEGLGLFACGARSAFGAGGWQDTALEAVLPVQAIQKEEKRDPSVALAIVIDTSGSMGGNRVQLAKEVARLAMRRLLPHDKVGIVEFYGAKRWAAPLQPASNNIELERAINRLAAGGGTVILPAIEEAFYGLLNVDARYKHVLVLTDGGVESGSFEPLLRRMVSRGITTSTVLIGGNTHSEFLVTLANWGKGRFYGVPDRFQLPEILFKQPTSAKLSAWQPGATAIRGSGGPSWWGELEPASLPDVAGVVETQFKPTATRVIETTEGERAVLASWRRGLGRVTAMPTEPVGPGAGPLADWPDYGRFLARTLERTARDLEPFRFELERDGRAVRLIATANDAESGWPVAERWAPGAEPSPLTFEARGPGYFEASWSSDSTQHVLAGARGGRSRVRLATDPEIEGQRNPAHGLDLTQVATRTGGLALGTADFDSTVPSGRAAGAVVFTELRPVLLALALLAYLLDLLDRRRPRGTSR